MSDLPPSSNDPLNTAPSTPAANPAMVRRRSASVQLRSGAGESSAALMDPANQSLADALRITYRLIQLAMVGLVVAYIASGFQAVKGTEAGIRVTLGEAERDPLAPGLAFSLPTPLGEVIRIDTSKQTIQMNRQFFPAMSEDDLRKPTHELAATRAKTSLDPMVDGHNITGDLSIAHSRWVVEYRIRERGVLDYAQNMSREMESLIVNRSVMRGVVHAVSERTIDEMLKSTPDARRKGPLPAIEEIAKEVAQQTLDEIKSGIEITTLQVISRDPPISLLASFSEVDTSNQLSQKLRMDAEQERNQRLTATAGDGALPMLALIAEFERATELKDQAAADAILAKIDALLEGRPVMVDGKPAPKITGKAASTIADAIQYRSGVVNRTESDAKIYAAKLAVYRTNPSVLVSGDWTDAYETFAKNKNTLAVWWVPFGEPLTLWLNTDPSLLKEIERNKLLEISKRANQNVIKAIDDNKYNDLVKPPVQMDSR